MPALKLAEGILFGLGNPLLDISATVDPEFLEKYNLEANNAILAEEKHVPMYKEMCEKYSVEYIPGGATQNAIRVAQWLLGVERATTFMGCIGDDDYGRILADKTKEAGINARYQISRTHPTGTCAVLLTDNGKSRSLCANLAAANHFTAEHLQDVENKALLEAAKYYYIAGFPLTVCPEVMKDVARQACDAAQEKTFLLNLSAPFICEFFKDPMMEVLPYVDVLFGNESEFLTFSKVHEFGTEDLKEIALKVADLPKMNKQRPRMVVVTQGAEPTLICKDGQVTEHPVLAIAASAIVDTNGAGDAFVGGFLAGLVLDRPLEDCVRAANYAANYIIQQDGCTLHEPPTLDICAPN